ncbi:MAG: chemotaxis protein CheW [Armatimonadota bacterium]
MSEVAVLEDDLMLPEQKLVRFQLGEEHFAFSVDSVTGIIRWREVTPLPTQSPHLLGLANLRGRTLPISDLRVRLGIPSELALEDGYVIVTENEHGSVGFLVDDVAEVITITETDIQEGVSESNSVLSSMVRGIVNLDNTLISIVDMNSLVGVSE